MIDLSVIVLNYNTSSLLQKCLSSIVKAAGRLKLEIIVVDNHSTDDSLKMTKKNFPGTIVVENSKNEGYSRGNNLGFEKAKGQFVLILNSDTEVVGESLAVMVEFLTNNKEIGILGPRLLNPDKTVQNSVGTFYSLPQVFLLLFGLERRLGLGREAPEKISFVDWVSGAAMLIRRNVYRELGGFDENYFMYMEEVDFCFRASRKEIKTAYLPQARIIHDELGSTQGLKTNAILGIYRGLIYYYRRYFPGWQVFVLKILLKTKALLFRIVGLLSGDKQLSAIYEQAYRLVK